MRFQGKVAVVTGASNGMGRELAVQLAARGVRGLAICDVNMAALEATAAYCSEKATHASFEVIAHKVDVSNRAMVEEWKQQVVSRFQVVDLVFNNAGVNAVGRLVHAPGTSKDEAEKFEQIWDRCFAIDFFGVLNCCRAFLPVMIATSTEGALCNTSSVNGFWALNDHSAYTSAKHAIKGLTDALHIDCQISAPHIKVSCVMPGGVRTNIVVDMLNDDAHNKSALAQRFAEAADLSSEQAAQWILDGVAKEKHRILVGYDAWLLDLMVRCFPERVYSFYASLGRSGMRATATNIEHNERVMAKPSTALKALWNGAWVYALFLWPLPIVKLRHSTRGKIALAFGCAALLAVPFGLATKLQQLRAERMEPAAYAV